jgi:hypothetical protein
MLSTSVGLSPQIAITCASGSAPKSDSVSGRISAEPLPPKSSITANASAGMPSSARAVARAAGPPPA